MSAECVEDVGGLVTELLAEPDLVARAAGLRRHGLADEAGLDLLLTHATDLAHDDPSAAEGVCTLCDDVATELELHSVSARARYLRARVLSERGALDEGLALIESAHQLWWDGGAHLQALRTGLGRMQILDDLGRHQDAVTVGESTLTGLDGLPRDDDDEQTELRHWLEAAVQENLGVALGFLGEHDRALESYLGAETTYRDLGMAEETTRPRANRGIELLALGRGREALSVLQAATTDFEAVGDRLWAAKCRGHVAQAHQQLGELLPALEAVRRARATLDELGAETESARLELTEADLYLAIGLAPEARSRASSASARATSAGMRHDAAAARFTLGLGWLDAGNQESAEAELNLAADLFDEVGDRHQRARVDVLLAELMARGGRTAEAVELATDAADRLRAGSWLVSLASAELWLADAHGDADGVAARLDEVGRLLEQLRLPQLRVPYLVRRARLLRAEGRTEAAEALLRDVIDEVDTLRATLDDAGLRRAFHGRRLAPYDALVELLVQRGSPGDHEAALRVSDRAKAHTLVDLVDGTIGPRRRGPTDPPAEAGDLLTDLHALYGELMSVEDPRRHAKLRRRADELEEQLSLQRLRDARTEPAPAADRGPTPAPWPTRLLSYHAIGSDLVCFVAQDGHTVAVPLPGVLPLVHDQLNRLGAQWSRFRMGAGLPARAETLLRSTALEILAQLHDLLVAPVADRLTGASGAPLVVVPPRELLDVPFHALYDGSEHLHRRWSLTLAPAAAGLPGPTPVGDGRGALVVAVPDERAPSLAREGRAVAAALPDARLLVGDQARTDELAAGARGGLDLLHLACHGLFRSGNPLFSSLRLSDRSMTAAEILELDLGGALVVLSACETGRVGGETAEPVGLAWAFLAAGASGVVVSHWLVDDEVTADLMELFHRHLASGLDPAEALRRAQVAIADVRPHPYHWAAFSYLAAPAATGTEM